MNVPPSKKAHIYIESDFEDTFSKAGVFMQRLASASDVTVGKNFDLQGAVSIITADAKMFIPMDELVDFKAEKARLEKERAAAQKDLDFVMNKLNNPGFVAKAPEKVVEGQREAAAKLTEKIKMLDESIASLGV